MIDAKPPIQDKIEYEEFCFLLAGICLSLYAATGMKDREALKFLWMQVHEIVRDNPTAYKKIAQGFKELSKKTPQPEIVKQEKPDD